MYLPKSLRFSCAVFMAVIMTNVPYFAWADAVIAERPPMIATSVLVDELSRTEAQQKVQSYLNCDDLKLALTQQGISPQVVASRLASLSDRELRDLASQMDRAQYGGDVTGILVVVLIVILIIFLVKRI